MLRFWGQLSCLPHGSRPVVVPDASGGMQCPAAEIAAPGSARSNELLETPVSLRGIANMVLICPPNLVFGMSQGSSDQPRSSYRLPETCPQW